MIERARVVVAMDGPSASGKSSTARGVARHFGLRYLDTGAMYRALTHWMLEQAVPIDDPEQVALRCADPDLRVTTDPDNVLVLIDGDDVSTHIRTPEVSAAVSAVSAVAAVRERLIAVQRSIIAEGGIVVEGRDIGTVVVPDAVVKVFLTADPEARAARRAAESGEETTATLTALHRRDTHDSSRSQSPLRPAADAVEVDATYASLEQVIDQVITLVLERTRAGEASA